jgi:hypothetical protein
MKELSKRREQWYALDWDGSAFTRETDLSRNPGNTIELSNVLEQVYYIHGLMSS